MNKILFASTLVAAALAQNEISSATETATDALAEGKAIADAFAPREERWSGSAETISEEVKVTKKIPIAVRDKNVARVNVDSVRVQAYINRQKALESTTQKSNEEMR